MEADFKDHYRKNMYDNFALGNECHRFGIMSGCHSNCPVYERGECEIQEENKKIFIENGEEI